MTKEKKWKIVEGVVEAIELALNRSPGSRVVRNAAVPVRNGSATRQVDVVVEIPAGNRTIRVGIEVKNHKQKLNITHLEQLSCKLRKLELDRQCVVSTSGFTGPAIEEALRVGLELHVLEQNADIQWWLFSTCPVFQNAVEILAHEIDIQVGEEERRLGNQAPIERITIHQPNGACATLKALLLSEGIKALGRPEVRELSDQEVFRITIVPAFPEGTIFKYNEFHFEPPLKMEADYRIHRNVESVALEKYAYEEGVHVFSGHSSLLGQQVSFVSTEQPAGGRHLRMVLSEGRNQQTRLEKKTT